MPGRRVLLAATISPILARADTSGWAPNAPVRVVVPFPPGAGMDILARLLAPAAAAEFGQPVVIENRPGAGTLIATEAMARTPPDGQAVLFVANSFTIGPSLRRSATYDPLSSFTPLARLTQVPHVLVVRPDLAMDFAGFLARARAPGPGLSFGSNGSGTSLHLGAEQLKLLAGLNATHVPYRGTPQELTDLVAGRIDWMYGNLPDVLPMIRDGRLRPLALAAAQRTAFLPEVPTTAELGFPGALSDSWYGVVMPAGGPPEIAARHAAVWLGTVRRPELRTRLEEQGFGIMALEPVAFAAAMRRDVALYAEVIRAAGVTAD